MDKTTDPNTYFKSSILNELLHLPNSVLCSRLKQDSNKPAWKLLNRIATLSQGGSVRWPIGSLLMTDRYATKP